MSDKFEELPEGFHAGIVTSLIALLTGHWLSIIIALIAWGFIFHLEWKNSEYVANFGLKNEKVDIE